MKMCPSCRRECEETIEECPGCGIFFAKWGARERRAAVTEAAAGDNSGRWTMAVLLFLAAAGGWQYFKGGKSEPVVSLSPMGKALLSQASAGIKAGGAKGGSVQDWAAGPGHAVEMQYAAEGFAMGLSASQSSAWDFSEKPDDGAGFKILPPEAGGPLYYGSFDIAGETFRVVTQPGTPTKIFFDANGNGDMTDDPGPANGERAGVIPNHFTLNLPYPKERISAEYRLWIFPSNMGGTRFYAACHTAGELSHPKLLNKYKLALFDGSSDGDYSNDVLVIDINADGKAQETEQLKPGKTVTVEGMTVTLKAIAPSGRKAVFAPFD